MSWSVDDLPDLRGRFAIVTGGNSGVGWQAAKALAGHGCRVLLACRDVDRAEGAAQRIRAAHPAADVDVARLDLSSMASVREFGESRVEPIDLLINNAGVMAPPKRVTTIDGFELQFATNHLGHFALTGLLLPMLMQAPSPRVVTVSSLAHRSGGTDVVDANAMGPYHAGHSYSNTKLANLLFAQELQRRSHANGSRLVSTAAHPGLSATGLVKDSSGMGSNLVIRLIGSPVMRVVAQSAAAGALPTLYAVDVRRARLVHRPAASRRDPRRHRTGPGVRARRRQPPRAPVVGRQRGPHRLPLPVAAGIDLGLSPSRRTPG